MNDQEPGQFGYEVYAEKREWTAYNGTPIPPWEAVSQGVKDAWEAVEDAYRELFA